MDKEKLNKLYRELYEFAVSLMCLVSPIVFWYQLNWHILPHIPIVALITFFPLLIFAYASANEVAEALRNSRRH